jgi:hypothetical protein
VMESLNVEVLTHMPAGSDGRRTTARAKGKVERLGFHMAPFLLCPLMLQKWAVRSLKPSSARGRSPDSFRACLNRPDPGYANVA